MHDDVTYQHYTIFLMNFDRYYLCSDNCVAIGEGSLIIQFSKELLIIFGVSTVYYCLLLSPAPTVPFLEQ